MTGTGEMSCGTTMDVLSCVGVAGAQDGPSTEEFSTGGLDDCELPVFSEILPELLFNQLL